MRLQIEFDMSEAEITIDYRYACLSFIKKLLSTNFEQDFKELYEISKIKSLTFNMYFPNARIERDKIYLKEKKCKLIISSADNILIAKLYNSALFMRNKSFNFPDNLVLYIRNAKILSDIKIESNTILIKFLSPLLVRVHNKNSNIDDYLTAEDENFNKFLNYNLNILQKELGLKNSKIELIPLNAKTTAVKLKGKYYRANYGQFILKGESCDLKLLYDSGLGSRRSQGFGMFELEATNV